MQDETWRFVLLPPAKHGELRRGIQASVKEVRQHIL
jgi:hypothetical protein